jgi:hypothetical protein
VTVLAAALCLLVCGLVGAATILADVYDEDSD